MDGEVGRSGRREQLVSSPPDLARARRIRGMERGIYLHHGGDEHRLQGSSASRRRADEALAEDHGEATMRGGADVNLRRSALEKAPHRAGPRTGDGVDGEARGGDGRRGRGPAAQRSGSGRARCSPNPATAGRGTPPGKHQGPQPRRAGRSHGTSGSSSPAAILVGCAISGDQLRWRRGEVGGGRRRSEGNLVAPESPSRAYDAIVNCTIN